MRGPEDGMKWQIQAEPFERKVQELMEVIKREPDLPPLIVWMTEKEEYAEFMEKYGKYMR